MIRSYYNDKNEKVMLIGDMEVPYWTEKDVKNEVIKYENSEMNRIDKKQLYDFLKGLSYVHCKVNNEENVCLVKKEYLKPMLLKGKELKEKMKYTITFDLEKRDRIIYFFNNLDKFVKQPNHWTDDINDFNNFENLFFNCHKENNLLTTTEDIDVKIDDDFMLIIAPYDRDFIAFAKEHKGSWCPTEKTWTIPKLFYEKTINAIKKIYKLDKLNVG